MLLFLFFCVSKLFWNLRSLTSPWSRRSTTAFVLSGQSRSKVKQRIYKSDTPKLVNAARTQTAKNDETGSSDHSGCVVFLSYPSLHVCLLFQKQCRDSVPRAIAASTSFCKNPTLDHLLFFKQHNEKALSPNSPTLLQLANIRDCQHNLVATLIAVSIWWPGRYRAVGLISVQRCTLQRLLPILIHIEVRPHLVVCHPGAENVCTRQVQDGWVHFFKERRRTV